VAFRDCVGILGALVKELLFLLNLRQYYRINEASFVAFVALLVITLSLFVFKSVVAGELSLLPLILGVLIVEIIYIDYFQTL